MIADNIRLGFPPTVVPKYPRDTFPLNSPCVRSFEAVGSQMIPGAARPDSDRDYILLINDWGTVMDQFSQMGFSHDGEKSGYTTDNPGRFVSMRKGDYNFIVTSDAYFYKRFMRAQGVAERLKVTDKADRIDLFRAIRDEPELGEADLEHIAF